MKVVAISSQNFGGEVSASNLNSQQKELYNRLKPLFQRVVNSQGFCYTVSIEGSKQDWKAVGENKQVVDMVLSKNNKFLSRKVQVGNSIKAWMKDFRKLMNISPINIKWLILVSKFKKGKL